MKQYSSVALTFFLFLIAPSIFAQSQARKAYIQKYKDIAIEEMDRTGIPASIKLAQAVLESADGTSFLAKNGNNHFGIKCGGNWRGPTVYRKDDDYKNGQLVKSCFRKYRNPTESFIAHSEFLRGKTRYAFLFDYEKTAYKKWAKGLRQAGYATNPKYPELLIRIIEENKLQQYDLMTNEVLVNDGTRPPRPKKSPKHVPNVSGRKIKVVNDSRVLLAKKGDNHRELAMTYKIPLKRLLQYNDLQRPQDLAAGEFVFLQPKRKKYRGKRSYHIIKAEQDLAFVAQKYGIRQECLAKRNHLETGQEPATGARIYLRKKAKKMPTLRTKRKPVPMTKPAPSKNKPPKNKPPKTAPTSGDYHLVQSGDTLWGISKKYGISVDQLKKINGLPSNTIKIGMKLKLR